MPGQLGIRSDTRPTVSACTLPDARPDGNVGSFEQLYQLYREPLMVVCISRLRDQVLAEDAVQETFARAISSLGSYDDSRRLWPWLVTIAQRVCIDVLRNRSLALSSGDIETLAMIVRRGRHPHDTTVDAVLKLENGAELQQALATLTSRQRRMLLLYAVDGWDYAEIAAVEGATVATVKSQIFRARRALRKTCGASRFPSILIGLKLGWGRMRRQLRSSAAQLQGSPILSSVGLFERVALASAILASTVTGATATGAGVTGNQPVSSRAVAANRPAAELRHSNSSAGTHSTQQMPADDIAHRIDSTGTAKPETSVISSFAVSPDFHRDSTVYAAGTAPCIASRCHALFVSHDGGRSWTRLAAKSFKGTSILLPPDFPNDWAIFAMSVNGLQVSYDMGTTFSQVTPMAGGWAISPRFDAGDKTILIGTTPTVMKFSVDAGIARPAYPTPTDPLSSVAFAPNYLTNEAVFVGSAQPTREAVALSGTLQSTLTRCYGFNCSTQRLASLGIPTVNFSPGFENDGTMIAYTAGAIFRSSDLGTSFKPLAMPGQGRDLTDVVVLKLGDSYRLLAGAVSSYPTSSSMYFSDDWGASWHSIRIDVPGFERGVGKIALLPSGRLLTAGGQVGAAVSDDLGMTWHSVYSN